MGHNDPFKGKTVDADWAYDLSRATTYTPALTATTTPPTLGDDGSITGWYHQNGHWITGGVLVKFDDGGTPGSATAGSGSYEISLPINADTSIMTANTTVGGASIVGVAYLRDNSTSTNSQGVLVALRTAGKVGMHREGVNGNVNDSNPFTWDSADLISLNFAYLADPDAL